MGQRHPEQRMDRPRQRTITKHKAVAKTTALEVNFSCRLILGGFFLRHAKNNNDTLGETKHALKLLPLKNN